jgi:hypothetical protein
MIRNFPNWKFVFGHLCELSFQPQEQRGGGRELPPTTAWRQFPAIFSTPAVELRVLSRNTGKLRFQLRLILEIYNSLPNT